MSLRSSLSPNAKFTIIASSLTAALLLEAAGLWVWTGRLPKPVPNTDNPAATPAPAHQEEVFTAPGAAPPPSASSSILSSQPGGAPNGAPNSAAAGSNAGPQAIASLPKVAEKSTLPAAGAAKGDPKMVQAKQLFDAGVAALKAKDTQKAAASFEQVLALAPNDLASHLNLATIYLGNKQIDKALPHLQKAVDIAPKDPSAQFQLARALLATGKVKEAIGPLQKTIAIAPKERTAHAFLAQALMDLKRPRDAYPEWVFLANADPHDMGAQMRAAAVANDVLRKPAEAEKWLIRATQANPREVQPALMLAQLQLGTKKFKAANATLSAIAKSRPDAFEIYPLLANARMASGDAKGAVDALESAIMRVPVGKTPQEKAQAAQMEGSLQIELGRLQGNARHPQEAAQAFTRAAQLLPTATEPRTMGALAQIQLKNLKGAEDLLNQAIKIDPKRSANRLMLAQVLAQDKRFREADAQMVTYNQSVPNDGNALVLWAQIAHDGKDTARELEVLTHLSRIAPKNPLIWAQLGTAQRDSNQKNAALASFFTLAKLRPDANSYFELARAQTDIGDYAGATSSWEAVLKSRPDYIQGYTSLLENGEKAKQSAAARTYLARLMAKQKEDPRALSTVLSFYEKRSQVSEAKAFLSDLVQRNPKAVLAKNALDSFAAAKGDNKGDSKSDEKKDDKSDEKKDTREDQPAATDTPTKP